ncbi:hypothetical protein CsSME_00054111 [Camellia sinensis var. sinensis]
MDVNGEWNIRGWCSSLVSTSSFFATTKQHSKPQ